MVRSIAWCACLSALVLSSCRGAPADAPSLLVKQPFSTSLTGPGAEDVLWVPLRPGSSPGDPSSEEGVLKGAVIEVDRALGKLTLAGERAVAVRARPERLLGIDAGDTIEVPYRVYSGRMWARSTGEGIASSAREPFSAEGVFSGPVSYLDVGDGVVGVASLAFLAHPEVVEDLLPGQLVRLSFADVGGALWVKDLFVARAAPE